MAHLRIMLMMIDRLCNKIIEVEIRTVKILIDSRHNFQVISLSFWLPVCRSVFAASALG